MAKCDNSSCGVPLGEGEGIWMGVVYFCPACYQFVQAEANLTPGERSSLLKLRGRGGPNDGELTDEATLYWARHWAMVDPAFFSLMNEMADTLAVKLGQ